MKRQMLVTIRVCYIPMTFNAQYSVIDIILDSVALHILRNESVLESRADMAKLSFAKVKKVKY